jgi:hypothetical protein
MYDDLTHNQIYLFGLVIGNSSYNHDIHTVHFVFESKRSDTWELSVPTHYDLGASKKKKKKKKKKKLVRFETLRKPNPRV